MNAAGAGGRPGEVESLLTRALPPVEPPEDLRGRLATTLQGISDLAAEELEGWELIAMRDPRNWVRPAVAVVGGAAAGAGLLLLGMHHRSRGRTATTRGESESRTDSAAPPGSPADSR
jgi:hypothetical protein